MARRIRILTFSRLIPSSFAASFCFLPLPYEGRATKLTINRKQIDKGFERLAKPLSEEAQKDLKRKFSSISKIYESDGVVEEIAYDISNHYVKNWKGTGAKAQLAVPRIDAAIKYQKYFESQTDPWFYYEYK